MGVQHLNLHCPRWLEPVSCKLVLRSITGRSESILASGFPPIMHPRASSNRNSDVSGGRSTPNSSLPMHSKIAACLTVVWALSLTAIKCLFPAMCVKTRSMKMKPLRKIHEQAWQRRSPLGRYWKKCPLRRLFWAATQANVPDFRFGFGAGDAGSTEIKRIQIVNMN